MSSTSSMYDCDDLYSYQPVRNFQEPWYDYYQTMGHPLVYYAEVQPSCLRSGQPSCRRSGVRKDPNFFVKAFRWYTQEHHPSSLRTKSENNPDFTGFANWLDAKYGQYIQENQQTIQQTAAEPRKPKRLFATMRSHFTKRHKAKKNGAGKSCNSCEYIMQPKEMSLTGSECRRSNVKAAVSDTLGPNKSGMKSHSLNDLNEGRYECQKSIEIMVTEGDQNEKFEEKCSCAKTEVLTIYDSKNNSLNGPLPCDRGNNTECQCAVTTTKTAPCDHGKNTECQCAVTTTKAVPCDHGKNTECQCAVTTTKAVPCDHGNNTECQCAVTTKADAQTQYQSQSVIKPATNKKRSQNKLPAFNSLSAVKKSHQARTSPDVSCQCSLEDVPPSVSTRSTKQDKDCKCTASFQDVIKVLCQNCQQNAGTVCNGPKVAIQPLAPVPAPAPPIFVTPMQKSGCLCGVHVNETAQTSDTSICLADEVTKYPFFMKIVRADKLITDC